MKKETLLKRLGARYKGAKQSIAYRVVLDVINGSNNSHMVFTHPERQLIRPVKTSGSGRFRKYADYTEDICNLLSLVGIAHELRNEAPRGGKYANYILIKTAILRPYPQGGLPEVID